jgi:prepilin-type N-terminal cleavage/methylation domain-containing protein
MKAYTFVEVLVVVAIVAVVMMMIIGGCNVYLDSQITEGRVVNKKFVAAHTTTHTNYIDVGDIQIPQTYSTHHPDAYYIYLEGKGKSGKTRTRQVAIDRQSYMILEIGDELKLSDIPLTPTAERE